MRWLCKVRCMDSSGFYAWRLNLESRCAREDKRLLVPITESWLESGGCAVTVRSAMTCVNWGAMRYQSRSPPNAIDRGSTRKFAPPSTSTNAAAGLRCWRQSICKGRSRYRSQTEFESRILDISVFTKVGSTLPLRLMGSNV